MERIAKSENAPRYIPANEQWEYRCDRIVDAEGRSSPTVPIEEFVAFANKLGADRWEIYQIIGGAIHAKRRRSW